MKFPSVQIPGHGENLARRVAPPHVAPDYPQKNAPPPAIGSVPLNFNGHPSGYTHAEILNIIIFYNDDFGIVERDNIGTRTAKLRAWLTEI
jgi:hypothetical protein